MDAYLDRMPIVAILAGLTPDRAEEVGMALVEAGITILEVPLRGADPAASLESVRILAKCVGDRALVGAGTVLTTEQVRQVRDAGARLIVSPNMDAAVITETRAHGLISLPGVFTPTEAFAAISLGASALKWFPTDGASPKMLKAMLAVLPKSTPVLAVGGVSVDNVDTWHATGAKGFGVGSAIWKPNLDASQVKEQAAAFARAVDVARGRRKPPLVQPRSVAAPPFSIVAARATAAAAAVALLVALHLSLSAARRGGGGAAR